MSTLIVILIIIVAVLLVVVVLAQNPKGGGLASGFGGSSATQFMGVKKTGDFLENATWVFAVLLLSLSLMANITVDTQDADVVPVSKNVEKAKEASKGLQQQAPPQQAPAQTDSIK